MERQEMLSGGVVVVVVWSAYDVPHVRKACYYGSTHHHVKNREEKSEDGFMTQRKNGHTKVDVFLWRFPSLSPRITNKCKLTTLM
jgi:hypothetical protein